MRRKNSLFGTKAETLLQLVGKVHHAQVPPTLLVPLEEWNQDSQSVCQRIQKQFGNSKLAVRSSAFAEDGALSSMAGAFESVLNVSTEEKSLRNAFEEVIHSYEGSKGQILVQEMIQNVKASGVILSYHLENGAPYYVINYDDVSGRTDTVTSGAGEQKTVLIHRDIPEGVLRSKRVQGWITLVRELEEIFGGAPLDIEFAQTNQALYLLQVRRVTLEKNWNKQVSLLVREAYQHIERFVRERSLPKEGVYGKRTILGQMPDWNPAEIIGTKPRPLASSLYRFLVTESIWRRSRGLMGYCNPRYQELMVLIGGSPYIDVRNSFNSFLPARVSPVVGEKLVNAWLDRLDENPDFHDKVEFDVVQTVYDFSFEKEYEERFEGLLSASEKTTYTSELKALTQTCIVGMKSESGRKGGSLEGALEVIECLRRRQRERSLKNFEELDTLNQLSIVRDLLFECRELGTLPFSIVARHAFIAEKLLRSAVERSALSPDRLKELRASIDTVAVEMSRKMGAVMSGKCAQEEFLEEYGHLRPGTYDICSDRYDHRTDLFEGIQPDVGERKNFLWSSQEASALQKLIDETGLSQVHPDRLLKYAIEAIRGREYAKFIFSRNLSDALEGIAIAAEKIGLSKDEVSFISIRSLLEWVEQPFLRSPAHTLWSLSDEGRRNTSFSQALQMSFLIRDHRDLLIVPLQRGRPNFITEKKIEGRIVHVNNRTTHLPDLTGMIVCIESADPGFDWIFSRSPSALITQYGGTNSHMAIRCAEFGLPAAIGCGEQTFRRVVEAGRVELNCADKLIRPLK